MKSEIKMVAVDVDGTFVRSDYTYDVPRFKRILSRMKAVGQSFCTGKNPGRTVGCKYGFLFFVLGRKAGRVFKAE